MSADSTPRPWSIADAHGDPPWPATEYIPGPSLHDVLRQQGALPTRTLHTLAVGVADALKRTHACGIIHRDLRPSNTIISSTGPRVIDFGIARALDSTALTRTNHSSAHRVSSPRNSSPAHRPHAPRTSTPSAWCCATPSEPHRSRTANPWNPPSAGCRPASSASSPGTSTMTRTSVRRPPRYSNSSPRTTRRPRTGCSLPRYSLSGSEQR
ncbi:protein kinase [Streptomyces sp. NPDC088560]|uniref:protein kinase domain-containing protein n=1 Tax=Streptomyces sp. NPDC088560 TaxID=3365868 RepID=UPI003815A550